MTGRELPVGWVEAELGDVADIKSGITLGKKRSPDQELIERPYLRVANVQRGKLDLSVIKTVAVTPDEAEALKLEQGDILMNEGGDRDKLGRGWIWTGEIPDCIHQNHVFRVRLRDNRIQPKYVSLYANEIGRHFFEKQGKQSVNLASINQTMVAKLPVPLPPLPEQRRIVGKIEALTARSRRAREALDALPALIDRYRQSILAAAFRGDLTEGWREHQGTGEPISASELAAMRRRLWEAVAANRQSARQVRYPNPEEVAEEAFELPEGWRWVTVDELCPVVQYGTSAKTSDAGGVAVLRMGNIQSGRLDFDSLKYLPADHEEFPELLLDRGDVLFNRTNSPELVGKSAVFGGHSSPCSFASYLIRLKVAGLDPRLLAAYINSPFGRSWARGAVSQQVGQANINGSKLKALAVPLPPATEQKEILRRVAAYGAAVLHLLEQHDMATARLSTLDQSILAKAFRGELVPQDPDDEPASVLLERIRAERAAVGEKPRRGRPRKAG